MTISFAIPVKDELDEINILLSNLRAGKRLCDEVVVLFDSENGSEEVLEFLEEQEDIELHKRAFVGNFADHKNYLNSLCKGDYIFQIDADESPDEYLLEILPEILLQNENIDLFFVPRVNTVEGLTQDHINKWGWNVNEKGWVNWPDHQTRIYRNSPDIKWQGVVHERIQGHQAFSALPQEAEFSLWHQKQIERQERQNSYYDTL